MKCLTFFWGVLAFLVVGCASVPQQPSVDVNFSEISKSQVIGVYISPIPKVTTSFPGASCLLCVAAASMANSSLTKQIETLEAEELAKARDWVIENLKEKGYTVKVINALIPDKKLPTIKAVQGSTLKKNYATYKNTHGIDQLLVLDFKFVGVIRQYSAYVANGAPYASVVANYYMLDVSKNNYTLYSPIKVAINADGEWDVAPVFPALTNAFYQAEEEAIDLIKKKLN